ncbi:hypothetical protein Dsin_007643 [Dipteronia sinensis]|uniref:Uncharacterized protein n=1 Tax=Dipteronia sinensis TaxID=43782 RepID=A0AAE0EGS4_9ROSI|nr:hypothetical protein Dsin_007643 [Dipteronia sinensis]
MGFPVAYTELLLPKILLHTLSVLGFIRKIISVLFNFLGLQEYFLEQQPTLSGPTRPQPPPPPSGSVADVRFGTPHPGNPSRREVLGASRPIGLLRRLSLRVRRTGRDQTADELPAHIPPELSRPLDGVRSEDVSALSDYVYS